MNCSVTTCGTETWDRAQSSVKLAGVSSSWETIQKRLKCSERIGWKAVPRSVAVCSKWVHGRLGGVVGRSSRRPARRGIFRNSMRTKEMRRLSLALAPCPHLPLAPAPLAKVSKEMSKRDRPLAVNSG